MIIAPLSALKMFLRTPLVAFGSRNPHKMFTVQNWHPH